MVLFSSRFLPFLLSFFPQINKNLQGEKVVLRPVTGGLAGGGGCPCRDLVGPMKKFLSNESGWWNLLGMGGCPNPAIGVGTN